MAEMATPETTEAPATPKPPKKKIGRPKGTPRTGGRKKGTPNRSSQVTRDYIVKEGAPVAFLCSVVAGRGFSVAAEPGGSERTKQFPTMDQRLVAARILAAKIVPDLKAVEHVGEDGGELVIRIIRFGDDTT